MSTKDHHDNDSDDDSDDANRPYVLGYTTYGGFTPIAVVRGRAQARRVLDIADALHPHDTATTSFMCPQDLDADALDYQLLADRSTTTGVARPDKKCCYIDQDHDGAVTLGPDPYDLKMTGDATRRWICESHRRFSAGGV